MKIGLDVAQTCVERAGCAWYADAMSRALVRAGLDRGHTFELYHHFGNWINTDVSRGTVIEDPRVQCPLQAMSASTARSFWADIAQGKPLPGSPDVVLSFSYQAPKISSAKLVYTVHDLVFWLHPEFATDETRLLCQRETLLALKRAAAFLFVSHHTQKDFDYILPGWLAETKRPTHIAPGASRFVAPRIDRRWSATTPWLMVGSIEPRKNHAAVFDAYEQYFLTSKYRRPLLIVGGSGWNSDELHARMAALATRGLPVRYRGYVPDDELIHCYAGSFGLLAPSWHEGFGLPVVEALTSGLPVLASNYGSLPEIAGEAAEYFPPNAPQQLAARMLLWESEPEAYQARVAAALRRAQAFSWDLTANSVLEFIARL